MDIDQPTPLLAGLSPNQFMRRHWYRQPLLVRAALPGITPPMNRRELSELAARDGVECRLIVRRSADDWQLSHGPIERLPPWSRPGWTLLVQGLEQHAQAAADLLDRFRFVPDVLLDDVMMSYASDGGGVGPHFDSYNVFLIQVAGRRRWRIGREGVATRGVLQPDVPLKILTDFVPEQEWVLETGDMLYLPPGWAHDGVAEGGDCMTCSIGFRAARRLELARELLVRLADALGDEEPGPLYRDRTQGATRTPGAVPGSLVDFATDALQRALSQPNGLAQALGEAMTEPKPSIWFEAARADADGSTGVRLDVRSRMLYDGRHIYLNGESFRASGRDFALMKALADARTLPARDCARLSEEAQSLVLQWLDDGWLQPLSQAD